MKNKLLENANIAVIGLGYVGFPLFIELNRKYKIVGYDIDSNRVSELLSGYDRTNELNKEELEECKKFNITSDEKFISGCNIFIITVPTPVDKHNKPDLGPISQASDLVGRYLSPKSIVIFESTVFPGCTEEICVPILEKVSGLRYNVDFFCGYSPERINPGDKKNTLTKITKVVSASNEDTLDIVENLYKSIISAGTYRAESIAVAEAAKVIENTQRDVNIALINELALIFDKLKINTSDVINAASTKWNFLPFKPGLVGGHCIGVDPYYITHKAIEVGHHPEIILAGRKINDNMGSYIAEKTISILSSNRISPLGAKITILGLSFKENCPDLRNTKVVTIIEKLEHYKCNISVIDLHINKDEAKARYNIDITSLQNIEKQDAIIIAVAHNEYLNITHEKWKTMLRPRGIIIDIKSVYSESYFSKTNFHYWSL